MSNLSTHHIRPSNYASNYIIAGCRNHFNTIELLSSHLLLSKVANVSSTEFTLLLPESKTVLEITDGNSPNFVGRVREA